MGSRCQLTNVIRLMELLMRGCSSLQYANSDSRINDVSPPFNYSDDEATKSLSYTNFVTIRERVAKP